MDYSQATDAFELEDDLYKHHSLTRGLTFIAYSTLIWLGALFLPLNLVAYVAAAAALIFVPIMIRELVALDRLNWVIGYLALVLLPTLLAYLLGPSGQKLTWTAVYFFLSSYIYTWKLRSSIETATGQLVHRLESIRRKEREKKKEEYDPDLDF